MSDGQMLLTRITALRKRLEEAQRLVGVAIPAEGAASGDDPIGTVEKQIEKVSQHAALFDRTLRQLDKDSRPPDLPRQLTHRARRALESTRQLLQHLRLLADDLDHDESDGDPLALLYRETVSMTEAAVRAVQAFPDSPSTQLHLCTGVEAILSAAVERLATIRAVLGQRKREAARIDLLAGLLTSLHECRAELPPFVQLAAAISEEARQADPLRFLYAHAATPARFIAAHSLSVAQVVARLVRYDPQWIRRPGEPVLAALLHDAGMLSVPAEILSQPGPLNDAQKRTIEAHAVRSAELVSRMVSNATWLVEAIVGHHERLDGTGYPDGRRALQLSPLARLLAVCDVYAALCSPRPHRPALDPRTALTDTLLLAESEVLDRDFAERLLQFTFYPVGSVVELADGSIGLVVATHAGRRDLNLPARPVLALLADSERRPLPVPRHLDLAQCEGRSVVRTLSSAESRQVLGRRYTGWAA